MKIIILCLLAIATPWLVYISIKKIVDITVNYSVDILTESIIKENEDLSKRLEEANKKIEELTNKE